MKPKSNKKPSSQKALAQTCGCIQHKKWVNYKKPENGKKLRISKIGSRHFSPAIVQEMLKDYLKEPVLCDSCHAYYRENVYNKSTNTSAKSKTSSPISRSKQSLLERCGCKKHAKWWNYLKDNEKVGGKTVLAISSKAYLKSVIERMKQAKLIRNNYLCKSCYSYLKDNWDNEKEKMSTIIESPQIEDSNCFDISWDIEIDPFPRKAEETKENNPSDISINETDLLSTEKFVDPYHDENNNVDIADDVEQHDGVVSGQHEQLDKNMVMQTEQQGGDPTNHVEEHGGDPTDHVEEHGKGLTGNFEQEARDAVDQQSKVVNLEQCGEGSTNHKDLQMVNDEDITEDISAISVDVEMEILISKMDVTYEISCDMSRLGKLLSLIGTKVLKNVLE